MRSPAPDPCRITGGNLSRVTGRRSMQCYCGDMSGRGAHEAQATFQDTPACFTEDEWKILKEWQKELYRNVMKEIHQALLSLGPLIVTTVFSLRNQDEEDPSHAESQEAADRICGDRINDYEESFSIKGEENLHLSHPPETESCTRKKDFPSPVEVEGDVMTNPEELIIVKIEENLHLIHQLETEGRERKEVCRSLGGCKGEDLASVPIVHCEDEAGGSCADPESENGTQTKSLQMNPRRCTYCDQIFIEHSELMIHMRVHKKSKAFTCSVCGKRFHNRTGLMAHKKSHIILRPYKCTECDKSYTKPSHLYQHQRTHTGERPYRCTQCEKSFIRSSNLYVHQKSHTGERPYQCMECGKSFTLRSILYRHQKIHTGERPYQCTECDKSFTMNSDLTKHLIIHTGEKPYECTVCKKTYRHSSTLSRHQRIHTGENPYGCTECKKSFTHSSALSRHQSTHTVQVKIL
ncbi:zinc finger protein 586-like [Ambystoma mexicanum]|uniref:zinc finger protein 586-like n=1 Tax=Ambystoma mexicanum TaxID=8296 RepID=UPI0037E6F7D9